VTVNVWPAIVTVPDRTAPVALGLTPIDTDPLPVPDAPAVTEIQSAFALAAHVQVDPVVTPTDAVPPATAIDALVGEIA